MDLADQACTAFPVQFTHYVIQQQDGFITAQNPQDLHLGKFHAQRSCPDLSLACELFHLVFVQRQSKIVPVRTYGSETHPDIIFPVFPEHPAENLLDLIILLLISFL